MHVIDVKKVLIIFFVYGMSFGHDLNIKPSSECDTHEAGVEVCPGTGRHVTRIQCHQRGCCWSAQPDSLDQQCFVTQDSDNDFGFKINNEYLEVQQRNEDPPYFKIDLSGTFYSYERDDFSPSCTEQLGSVMESKAQSMISPVNSRIGMEFCLDKTTADILLMSTASSVSTSGTEGVATNSFIMRVGGNQTIGEVNKCATEISGFLEDLLNWGVPILPPPLGCPTPIFYNSQFDNVGNNWICLGSNEQEIGKQTYALADNTLGYEISLAGDFVTYNNIPMDSQCTAAYSNQFLQETLQMVTQVNGLIGNQLCSDYPGMVLSTATSSLSSTDNLGYTRSSFIASLQDDMYFDWVYQCGDEISRYLQDFDHWGLPILDQVPGCPFLIFQNSSFEEVDQTWICLTLT